MIQKGRRAERARGSALAPTFVFQNPQQILQHSWVLPVILKHVCIDLHLPNSERKLDVPVIVQRATPGQLRHARGGGGYLWVCTL